MSKWKGPRTQNTQNTTQNTQTPPPKADPIKVEAIVGSISETLANFIVKIKIKVRQGIKRIDGTLSIIEGIDTIDSAQITNGDCFYVITEPLTSAGKSRTLIFSLDGQQDIEGSATIDFPSKATKESNKKDPDELQVTRHRQANGANSLFLRVVDALGNGIKTVVQVCVEGTLHDVLLDKHGTAVWTAPRLLQPRETIDADVCVSGIQEKAKVVLRGPRPNHAGRPPAWSGRWWFRTNNGRGVLFLLTMIAIWTLTLIIGPGDPLFSFDHTKLSKQELSYNQGTEYYKATIDNEKVPSDWHKTGNIVRRIVRFILVPFITIFASLYFFFSLREEIVEGTIEGFELLVDRPYIKSKDPLAEHLMSMAGVKSTARRNPLRPQIAPSSEPETPGEETAKKPAHVPFFELLRSDMASDFLVVVLPQIIRHYFR